MEVAWERWGGHQCGGSIGQTMGRERVSAGAGWGVAPDLELEDLVHILLRFCPGRLKGRMTSPVQCWFFPIPGP